MARWQQCLRRFSPHDSWASAGGWATADRDTAAGSNHELTCTSDTLSERPRFRVTVDSFQTGHPVVFKLTVHHGDAVWRIRRRYQQVWAVHMSLVHGLGRSTLQRTFPQPPPRTTWRSAMFGQTDRRFLQDRATRLQLYFDALLQAVPFVEQCEALYKFLCYSTLRNWEYGAMVSGGAPPVDPAAVTTLPRAAAQDAGDPSLAFFCVICQTTMDLADPEDDIRELPCGHLFHFRCISQWLKERNTCCVCNGAAILTAPRLTWPSE
mmetsp:Transcript_1238/g.3500  ORF Transcript_1238/g.3500 Transcript_1238/m.3500 type:complete len:265 (-) Transcript_1238:306-1100(-)